MTGIVTGGEAGHLGSAIAHTAERIGTFQRTQDRLDWERTQNPERQREEQLRIQREKEIADRAAKRLADKLAKDCQDQIDIANKVLVIHEGYRYRKCPITHKWEHVWN